MDYRDQHTFVIMAYKSAPYLETTIESCLNQTIPSSVCIATSTPNERILGLGQKYNLPVYTNPDHRNIAGDWSFAISCAQTPLATLADQDDLYHPDFSSTVVQCLEKNPDLLICFSHYNEIDEETQKRPLNATLLVKILLLWPFYIKSTFRSRFWRRLILRLGDPICSPAVTYHLAQIKDHSLFDENYAIALDWDAWLRLCDLEGAFSYIRRPILDHRIHQATQTSFGIQGGKRYNEDLKVLQRLWPNWIARLIAWAYSASYHSNH
ncbi:MAG: glycosyltransferase [Clostridia bacterium]|nr:glycosyltransferase [Clostridia bacterium]